MIVCNLKAILENRGMTQKDLAEAIYAHEATISHLCNNKFERVNMSVLDGICNHLGIKLSELMIHIPESKK